MFDVSDKNEFIGKTPKDFSPEYQPDGKLSAEKERDMIIDAMTGKPQFYEWQCVKKDGTFIDLEVNLTSFESFDRNLLIAIVRDITGRKKVEEKIKSSLKEKEILLREVHHRVKNNLQIISSIINLQANNTKKDEIKTVIKEIRNRILSMALIHEKLYQSDNIAKVEFSSYVRSLIMGLFTTYGITHDKVKMEIDVYNVPLNLDFVVPCGLIVNEIVSNSVKYAFPGNMKGKITVRFKPLQDGEGYELDIIDNGIGMPKEIDFHKTETLGLRLIRALITQLGGDVKIVKDGGTHYHIDFKSKWYL
jgi:PAS domain S-box-containing protein